MDEPLLAVRSLSVSVGKTPILRGLTLDLNRGDRLALVGESGAGKTTTARALLGLFPEGAQVDGEVRYESRNVLADPSAFRGRKIGLIFQEPSAALDPVLTVGAQIIETLALRTSNGASRIEEAARALLDRVELSGDLLDAYPHELSGGMQQRVMIALAICLAPNVIVADEPTSALDLTTQAKLIALLDRVCSENDAALLFITHDLGLAFRVATHIAVMHEGEVVEHGTTQSLQTESRHPYTRSLLSANPHLFPRPAGGRFQT